MPFDAMFLSAMTQELSAAAGARIDRVQQPSRDAVLLSLRSRDANRKLLISTNPNHPRVQFTALSFENPAQPPMFCMLLRKHLVGARIVSFVQTPMERVLDVTLDCLDELGNPARKHLLLELMGRTSNLILTGPDNRILDCLRRVDLEMSDRRQVLPGLFYREPPPQDKQDPLSLSAGALAALLEAVDVPTRLDKFLLDRLGGLSPLLCRELAFRAGGETDRDILSLPDRRQAAETIVGLLQNRLPYRPVLLRRDGLPTEFSCLEILQYGDFLTAEAPPTFSALLDEFYGGREREERKRQRTAQLHKLIATNRDRTARKLELQKKELSESKDREQLRRCGDLIFANLSRMTRGQNVLLTEDFYDPDLKEIRISLSPQLSPQQNAAKYYKDYARAKNAEKILTEQIGKGEQTLQYLQSVLEELTRAESEQDLAEIRAELQEQGYLRPDGKKKERKQPSARPLEFLSTGGYPLLVGRNNRQNDVLTLKTAGKSDLWLHAQKIHGSHVIIVCHGASPDDQTMTEAAQLAALFSQAGQSQNVPVDCTEARNVKKPIGSPPGMVIYDRARTLYVTPDAALPERLQDNK
ncbi:MAG: NFACT RNA binding domain-containing protein [Oscillospiraceae bacterium]|nr:NFACT RNA binding domain-containing protein [Oscillospiraceae bacterium]